MKCTLIKKDKNVEVVKVALGDAKSDPLELNTPTDISKLTGLDAEKDLSKLKLVDGSDNPIEDSAVAVSKQTAMAHAYAVDAKATSELKAKLAGNTFTDDHGTKYVFEKPANKFEMQTITMGTYKFSISFHPGYCILRNIDPETTAYPRTDALYYAYEETEEGYTLTMTAPTVPSQYAPSVINLKLGAPAKEAGKDESGSSTETSPDAAKEDIQASVVDDTTV